MRSEVQAMGSSFMEEVQKLMSASERMGVPRNVGNSMKRMQKLGFSTCFPSISLQKWL